MKKLYISFAVFLVLGASLYAGPFGLEFGMTLEQVKSVATVDGKAKNTPYIYLITPPKKSSFFSDYAITISPKYGLFSIMAIGNTIDSDTYGEKIRAEFKKVRDMISQTYGEPSEELDYLKAGSIWSEPRDWLTAVREGERVYEAYWVNQDGAPLPPPLDLIILSIGFPDSYSNKYYLTLTYSPTWFKDVLDDALAEEENVF